MKRLFALSALLLVALAPAAWASNPNHPGGCHGRNDVPCRPDPQPTHGADCTHSDDHSCEVTTSTSTTTTTAPAPGTTTTTRPAPTGTPVTTSTTEAGPATSVTAAPTSGSPAPALRRCDSSELCPPATAVTELPATGAGTDVLVGLGLWCLLSGGAALLIAQLMRGAR